MKLNFVFFLSQQLYSCPISWYHLTVYKIDTSMVVSSLTPTSFEYELEYLPSYTSFEVNIYHKNHKLFSQEIHTLEGGEFTSKERICIFLQYRYVLCCIYAL